MSDNLDYLRLYHLESYLFETVAPRFHAKRRLSAFDLICIANWNHRALANMLPTGYASLETKTSRSAPTWSPEPHDRTAPRKNVSRPSPARADSLWRWAVPF